MPYQLRLPCYFILILLIILFYHVSSPFFFIIDLYLLIPAVIAQVFNPLRELVIPIRIKSKEVKAKIEIYPVIVEAKIRKCSI